MTYYVSRVGTIFNDQDETIKNTESPWDDAIYYITPGTRQLLNTAEDHAKALERELYDLHNTSTLFTEGDQILVLDQLGDKDKRCFILMTVTATQVLVRAHSDNLDLSDFDLVI